MLHVLQCAENVMPNIIIEYLYQQSYRRCGVHASLTIYIFLILANRCVKLYKFMDYTTYPSL